MERSGEGRTVSDLYAEASYPLRVESGAVVKPPPDGLRLLLPSFPEQLRVPAFLEGCTWVLLSVRLSEKDAELHWDAYAE